MRIRFIKNYLTHFKEGQEITARNKNFGLRMISDGFAVEVTEPVEQPDAEVIPVHEPVITEPEPVILPTPLPEEETSGTKAAEPSAEMITTGNIEPVTVAPIPAPAVQEQERQDKKGNSKTKRNGK